MKLAAVRIIELDGDHAALHDQHLLQILDLALDRVMIVRRFDKTGLVRQQTELQRRAGIGKEPALPDGGPRPDDLGIESAVALYSFVSHGGTSLSTIVIVAVPARPPASPGPDCRPRSSAAAHPWSRRFPFQPQPPHRSSPLSG